jgi:hypothetical protein
VQDSTATEPAYRIAVSSDLTHKLVVIFVKSKSPISSVTGILGHTWECSASYTNSSAFTLSTVLNMLNACISDQPVPAAVEANKLYNDCLVSRVVCGRKLGAVIAMMPP